MKIIQAVNSDLKPGCVGMRTVFCRDEARRKGNNVRVYSKSNFSFFQLEALIRNGLRYYVFPKRSPTVKLNLKFDKLVAKKMKKEFDIFHTWDILPLSMSKAKALGAKVIVDIQMAPVADYYNNPDVDLYICPSPWARQCCLKVGIPDSKITLIPFGVATKNFIPPNFKIKNMFKVLFVGNINQRKGIPQLLQAWSELNLPHAKLLLCGRVSKDCSAILKQYKHNYSIVPQGFLKGINLVRTYQRSDVFILPSLEEGSAKVVYEALACGLPTICTFESGSVVDDEVDGMIIDNSVADIKLALESMYWLWKKHYVGFKDMAAAARAKAEDYPWQRYCESVIDAYEGLLKVGVGEEKGRKGITNSCFNIGLEGESSGLDKPSIVRTSSPEPQPKPKPINKLPPFLRK